MNIMEYEFFWGLCVVNVVTKFYKTMIRLF